MVNPLTWIKRLWRNEQPKPEQESEAQAQSKQAELPPPIVPPEIEDTPTKPFPTLEDVASGTVYQSEADIEDIGLTVPQIQEAIDKLDQAIEGDEQEDGGESDRDRPKSLDDVPEDIRQYVDSLFRQAMTAALCERERPTILADAGEWATATDDWYHAPGNDSYVPCTLDESGESVTVFLPCPESMDPNVYTGQKILVLPYPGATDPSHYVCISDVNDAKIRTVRMNDSGDVPQGWSAFADMDNRSPYGHDGASTNLLDQIDNGHTHDSHTTSTAAAGYDVDPVLTGPGTHEEDGGAVERLVVKFIVRVAAN